MEKTKQIIGIMALLIPILAGTGEASLIGYNDTPEYLHVWNNGTIEPNYYYSGECMNQLSNQPNETWSLTNKYLGTYHDINGFSWVHGGEQYPCIRTDESDFSTYSNNTATNIIEWGQNRIELEIKSNILLNEDMITQTYRFFSTRRTNFDVWFLFNETNISITGDTENDYFLAHYKENQTIFNGTDNITTEVINREYYNLSQLRANNQTVYINSTEYEPFYFIEDWAEKKNIQNDFRDNPYEWFIEVDGDIRLYVNLGEFDRNEEKIFNKKWVDATCSCLKGTTAICFGGCWLGTTGCNDYVDDSFEMRAWVIYTAGFCSDCSIFYRTNQTGTWDNIQKTSGKQLRCNTTTSTCAEDDTGAGSPYTKQIMCEQIGYTQIEMKHSASICGGLSPKNIMSATTSTCAEHDIRLISPSDNSNELAGNITFNYNFTRPADTPLNCSLILDGAYNENSTDVATGEIKGIGSNLEIGTYDWRINCTGIEETNFPRQEYYIMNYSQVFNTDYLISSINAVNIKNSTWLNFSGTAEYLNPDGTNLLPDMENINYTVSMWFKHDSLHVGDWSNQQALFTTRTDISSGSPYLYLTLRSNQYQMRVCDTYGCDIVTEPQRAGEWNHIVAVYGDSPEGNLTMYLNGNFAGTNDKNTGWLNLSSKDFWIGGDNGFAEFNGTIDEVRIYNRSLTEAEATNIFNQGTKTNITLLPEGLIYYYPINEYSGTKSYDIVERKGNVTFVGTPTWETNGGLINLGSGNYSIKGVGTVSEFNLTNKDYDSSYVNISYTQGAWKEWTSQETWTLNVVSEILGKFKARERAYPLILFLLVIFTGAILKQNGEKKES